MALFDKPIQQMTALLDSLQSDARTRCYPALGEHFWPEGGQGSYIMEQDTAIELGHPKTESISFLLWTETPGCFEQGRITLIGPELNEMTQRKAPFGQVILLEMEHTDEKDGIQRFRQLEAVKYRIDLQGYMRRGASQFLREWSRVSNSALRDQFSFQMLGSALIQQYQRMPAVTGTAVIFITAADVLTNIKPIATQALRTISALNKMLNEAVSDCETCEYSDICEDVTELQAMRASKYQNRGVS